MSNIALENITEEDIEFMEEFDTPRSFCEIMFSSFDNPAIYEQEAFGEVRLFQEPFLSDQSIIDFDTTAKYHKLDHKEKFQLRKNISDLYLMGARKFGKTLIAQRLELIVTIVHAKLSSIGFGSVDLIHLNRVLDKVKMAFTSHPILKLFTKSLKGAPNHVYHFKNNISLESVNFNIGAKNPGQQWYGQHCDFIFLEESSLETEEVYSTRIEAENESGAVIRSSGMCNFVPFSPPGKAFYAPENKKHVINLPEYVNKWTWDEKEKTKKLEQYGGEGSIGYKVYCAGEICSDGIAVFQMDRVAKECYLEVKKGKTPEQIKRFEINKENFFLFKSLIVIERPNNADRIFLAADIGERVTEITIFSEVGEPAKYRYLYNITLYNTTHLERVKIFEYIIEKINANVIALDAGDGAGRALYSELEKKYGNENLVYYDGSMKLDVDFTYDENKNMIMESGLPVYRQEKMSTFSVERLMTLLYGGRCIIPQDYRFHTQFSMVMSIVSGTNIRYKCASESGDHLLDSWRVFAISQFIKKDFNSTSKIKRAAPIGAVGIIRF